MKKFGAEEILERAELYGRTFVDENKEKLYFNWSLSGFEVDFCGTCLEAELEWSAGFPPGGRSGRRDHGKEDGYGGRLALDSGGTGWRRDALSEASSGQKK